MAITRLHIEDFLKQSNNRLVLDVRSPSEYRHAHFPGAVSLPLFSDEERKVVGTAYKQESREKAIKIGLDYFGPRMREIVEQVETLLKNVGENERRVFVYCWRGGMRSGAMAWLLDLYGFKLHVLNGGYKAFRHYCLESYDLDYSLQVIGGYTGSGKTSLLQALQKDGQPVIDLEHRASHRGSVYGGFGLPAQPSQEAFENSLALAVRSEAQTGQPIFVEDESRKIGQLFIPHNFWEKMQQAPLLFLDIPFEERLQHILKDYEHCSPEELKTATSFIRKRLGGLDTKNTLAALEENDRPAAFRILLRYYDKVYRKGLHNRNNSDALIRTISCETVGDENRFALKNHKHYQ